VDRAAPFTVLEATVARLHEAYASGRATCVDVVRASLARIAAYDRQGPSLHAMIAVHPRALDLAAAMDRDRERGAALPPLHGIPLVLKDNFDTADLPTTSGAVTFRNLVPPRDAFVVDRLRAAGAIIIGKTNMTELAYGGSSVSSLGGQALNPYDLTRTPGGSSGGTGAAIAASYAVLGTGSDTGQSIRSPASACGLIGVRPTRGLISRRGIVPFSPTQDEVGPITRTVEDAARMLDVMAGIDPEDPVTERSRGQAPPSYREGLRADALRGARLALLTSVMGQDQVHAPVNAVVGAAVEQLRRLGATVIPVEVPGLEQLMRDLSLMRLEFADALARYLATLGPLAPVRTLGEFVARGECHPSLRAGLAVDAAVQDGPGSAEYRTQLARRERLRDALLGVLEGGSFEAIIYPHQRRLAVPVGEEQVDRNGVLSNGTGLPALCFPGGRSPASATAPAGVPVGLELLGRDWSEPRLLALAACFERHVAPRVPPASTPDLGQPSPRS
jgi:Asp-tRNA(Asn)/Glu-tRNA(Gln) amidotransferase A subunit family amidase